MAKTGQLKIYDLRGQLFQEDEAHFETSQFQLPINNVFIVRLETADGLVSRKILVQ